ncbi:MAG: hypothetical protein MUC87_07105 [Bacteroidia bacterium]|jgi:hypothetical protein|nr:hypothetical protein [Bacteroidia bacterium]
MNLTSPSGQPTGDKDPKPQYQVPPEGSLGLLALGWQGLKAWREARRAAGQNITGNEQKS